MFEHNLAITLATCWNSAQKLVSRKSLPFFENLVEQTNCELLRNKLDEVALIYRVEKQLESIELSKGYTAIDFLNDMNSLELIYSFINKDTKELKVFYDMFKSLFYSVEKIPLKKAYITNNEFNKLLDELSLAHSLLVMEEVIIPTQDNEFKRIKDILNINKDLFINYKKLSVEYFKIGRIPRQNIELFEHYLHYQLYKKGIKIS